MRGKPDEKAPWAFYLDYTLSWSCKREDNLLKRVHKNGSPRGLVTGYGYGYGYASGYGYGYGSGYGYGTVTPFLAPFGTCTCLVINPWVEEILV